MPEGVDRLVEAWDELRADLARDPRPTWTGSHIERFGALIGRDRIRAIAARLPLVKVSDIDRTEAWFGRHGRKTVFFGRMVPLFRSFVSIPAGVERMPILTFLVLTTLGSLIWNTLFVLAGYVLGENRRIIETYAGTYQNAVLAAGTLAVVAFVVVRLVAARRNRQRV